MKYLLSALTLSAAAVLTSCASSAGDSISKVNRYKLNSRAKITAADPAIRFEQQYRAYGAVSAEDIEARDGYYYTVHYSLADASAPATLKFSFRAAKTGSQIHQKSLDVSKKSGTAEFTMVGEELKTMGHIHNWKVTLERGGQQLAEYKSYLWE